jgi:hypothetical protein
MFFSASGSLNSAVDYYIRIMKKISALLLFAILFANTAGFYVYYTIALHRIHTEMRAKLRTLPDEQLSRLAFTKKTFKAALVEEGEVNVNGKMYDIARMQFQKDSIIAFAMHDEKEENFLAFANEVVSKPFEQDANVTGSVLQFISLLFLPGQNVNNLFSDSSLISHQSTYLFLSNTFHIQHKAPPPRNLSTSFRLLL